MLFLQILKGSLERNEKNKASLSTKYWILQGRTAAFGTFGQFRVHRQHCRDFQGAKK
jgi:hypothetical protein